MVRTSGAPPYLRALNAAQRRAVLHTQGPLLVLAGAGSGKTRMLVHRIAHLIRGDKVPPGRILALTFTNRAADEMRGRVHDHVGEAARGVTVCTFHALGARVLREYGERLGLPRRFAIYAAADQLGALRLACAEVSIDNDTFDLKRVLRRIGDWKTRGVTPDRARAEVAAGGRDDGRGTRADDYAILAADAYPRYEEVLRANGAVDFDDLLLLAVRLLATDEDAARALWRRWHYLMIDEYQDTNAVQLELARALAGPRRNLCVVGDDDQSIYAFRGADVGNILAFETHFPGAAVVTLEENYRSTQRILDAANAVIAGNPHRRAKRLRTGLGVGAPVERIEHDDDAAEADAIAKELAVRRFAGRSAWGGTAVLYRTNPQARVLEQALRQQGVPYRVIGGTSFFDRREVADAVAYLRAVANGDDALALRRIINVPARGIGRGTVLRLAERARAEGRPFGRLLADGGVLASLPAAQAAALAGFTALLDAARADLARAEAEAAAGPPGESPPLGAWAERLFRRLRLEDELRADPRNARSVEARIDNLRDVAGTLARLERRVWADAPADAAARAAAVAAGAWSPPTLADGLAWLALADREDADDADTGDRVTLMTLHAAKGLEFDEVYLVGLEEGILPHARSLEAGPAAAGTTDAVAEERRLLYVGMTRARRRLVLSSCRLRRRGREPVPALPSRYLAAIPAAVLDVRTAAAPLSAEESAALRSGFMGRLREMLGPDAAPA